MPIGDVMMPRKHHKSQDMTRALFHPKLRYNADMGVITPTWGVITPIWGVISPPNIFFNLYLALTGHGKFIFLAHVRSSR